MAGALRRDGDKRMEWVEFWESVCLGDWTTRAEPFSSHSALGWSRGMK